jgi:hypothetical protein
LATSAQTSDTAIRHAAMNNAIQLYKQFSKPPAALFNGPEYVEYAHTLQEGQPFFDSNEFDMGQLMFDNMLYENLPLKYDLVLNELVTLDPSKYFKLTLFHDKIKYFQIHGHTFIRIVKDSSEHSLNTGIYDRIYETPKLKILKKEQRKVMTYVSQLDGVRNVIEAKQDFYFSVNNGHYVRANNKSSILDVLSMKRDELSSFIRKNKLRFSFEEMDQTILKIADYYLSLTK